MINFGGSKESEYWSFPLPPISPHMPNLKSSASSVDVRALKSSVKVEKRCFDRPRLSSACRPCMCIPQIYWRLHCSGASYFCPSAQDYKEWALASEKQTSFFVSLPKWAVGQQVQFRLITDYCFYVSVFGNFRIKTGIATWFILLLHYNSFCWCCIDSKKKKFDAPNALWTWFR